MKYVLLLLILIISCEHLVENKTNQDSKLVVEAYLAAGDTVSIRLSSSATVGEKERTLLDGLFCQIEMDGQLYSLNYKDFSAFGSHYTLSNVKVPFTGRLGFRALFNGDSVFSYAHLPQRVKVDTFFSQYKRDGNGKPKFEKVEIEADFPQNEQGYKVEIWSEQDRIFQNKPITMRFLIYRAFAEHNGQGKLIIMNGENKDNYALNPLDERFFLTLTLLDPFYVQFRKAIESQVKDGDGLGAIFGHNVSEVPTNIENGYGIFTLFNHDTLWVKLK